MASAARGGGATHLVDLLPALRRAGWDCEAAVGRDGPLGADLAALGIPVHYVDLMGRRLAPLRALRLTRLTAELGPDIVHLHGTRAAFFHAIGTRRRMFLQIAGNRLLALPARRYIPVNAPRIQVRQVPLVAVRSVGQHRRTAAVEPLAGGP